MSHKMAAVLMGGLLASSAQAQLGTNLVVETFVGSAFSGTVDGQGTRTMFQDLGPIVFGDNGLLYCWQSWGPLRIVDTNASVSSLTIKIVASPYATDLLYHDGSVYQQIGSAVFVVGADGVPSRVFEGSTAVWHPQQKAFFASNGNKIQKAANGTLSDFVGSGNSSQIDGNGLFCSFLRIQAILLNAAGELLVVDNHSLRKVTMDEGVTTIIPEGKFLADNVSKFIPLDDGSIVAAKQNQILVFDPTGKNAIWLSGRDGTVRER